MGEEIIYNQEIIIDEDVTVHPKKCKECNTISVEFYSEVIYFQDACNCCENYDDPFTEVIIRIKCDCGKINFKNDYLIKGYTKEIVKF